MSSPWLEAGWIRDHVEGSLHRVRGEAHRGPDGASGWSDRKLAVMLRDHVQADRKRERDLRLAQTRSALLRLADAWGVPYMSQQEWEEMLDTEEDWFRVAPVSRGAVCPYLDKKIVVLARMADVENHPNEEGPSGASSGMGGAPRSKVCGTGKRMPSKNLEMVGIRPILD